jgi:hypothetical protein
MNSLDVNAFLTELRARAAAAADAVGETPAYAPAVDEDLSTQVKFYKECAEAAGAEAEQMQVRLRAALVPAEGEQTREHIRAAVLASPASPEAESLRRACRFLFKSRNQLGQMLADAYLELHTIGALDAKVRETILRDLGEFADIAIQRLWDEDEDNKEDE